jgi:cell division septal protein FtsQ
MWGRLSSMERGNDRFTARRRLRRRRVLISLCLLALFCIGGIIYGLRQHAVRISEVQIFGADQSLAAVATAAMEGSYFGIIPRNSTFFYPASRIRADIIALHPDIAAVSLFRSGFTGLSIRISDRVPIARWCGLAPTTGVDEYCYVFDASGFVFSPAGTSTETINSAKLYAPLAGDTLEPLRATVRHADDLPSTFDFARQLATFGSPVSSIIIRDDEVDDLLISGTRITYVLGHEQDAYTALVSAKQNLNLKDGSINYVDLRFDGKVYVKRVEE